MSKALKIIISVVVALALVGGTVGLITAIDSGKFDTKKISPLNFSVGGLDSTGSYMDTDGSIYTKDAFECQGLTCTLDFDALIEYQIYFYDQNNDFVHTTGKLTTAFVPDSIPFFAKFARVVITPTEDEKVTTLEVLGYARQLKIKVNREQGYKNYTENLIELEFAASTMGETGVIADSEVSTTFVSKHINISAYEEALVFGIPSSYQSWYVYQYDSSKTFISRVDVLTAASVSFVSSEGITYYNLNFSDLDEDTIFLRVVSSTATPHVLCCR